jgi:hypothetical protein
MKERGTPIRVGLICLTIFFQNPCWGAPPVPPNPSTLPCANSWTRVARDTHVFFPDENLERLALRLSSGLYADKTIYDRLVRDVAMIRERDPELKHVGYRMVHNVRVLLVSFQPLTFWLARAHLYGDWNCLNRFLGADVVFHPESDYAELIFAGLYNPYIVSKAYRALPGVTLTEFESMLGDSSNLFVTREATGVWHYIFNIAGGDCPSGCTTADMHYFAITPDGRIQTTATWNFEAHAPPPAWATAYFRKYQ